MQWFNSSKIILPIMKKVGFENQFSSRKYLSANAMDTLSAVFVYNGEGFEAFNYNPQYQHQCLKSSSNRMHPGSFPGKASRR